MFFECLGIVRKGMPEGSTTEETLKVMDHVAKLASKLRSDQRDRSLRNRFSKSGMPDLFIRYRDADHNLTKTVVTAEDSIDALVKFKRARRNDDLAASSAQRL